MIKPSTSSLIRYFWIFVPLCLVGLLFWANQARIARVEYVTSVGRAEKSVHATARTGYLDGTRGLIIPEHVVSGFGWVAQTQQMLAESNWRVRHIDYENAPYGREVRSPSPYRWWLGLVAETIHQLAGVPRGLAVERSALYADPALQVLLLLGVSFFVGRNFGPWPAMLASFAVVALFPFAAGFLPGVPDDYALALMVAPWSVLPLLAGAKALFSSTPAGKPERVSLRWFILAGGAGGVGLWISVTRQTPILAGVALGALLAAAAKPSDGPQLNHWRVWSLAGAVTVLIVYLIEYFPIGLGNWDLSVVHPLYGLAWLGLGEAVGRMSDVIQKGWRGRKLSEWLQLMAAILAIATLPVVIWKTKNAKFAGVDVLNFRLTKQADGVMAPNLKAWLVDSGPSLTVWVTLLPLLLLAVALGLIWSRRTGAAQRYMVALSLGPILVALGFASAYLQWWQMLGAVMVPLLVAAAYVPPLGPNWRRLTASVAFLVITPGLWLLMPGSGKNTNNVLTLLDAQSLVERDVAHWLAEHSPAESGPLVFAPPSTTSSLSYYGGFRGLGTLSAENNAGLSLVLRVVMATSLEEARLLLEQRGVTHVIIPSWDPFFQSYLQSGSGEQHDLFVASVTRMALPPWLRPIPYELPTIAGFEGESLRILQLVEDQDAPLAAGRLVEYFIEMGELRNAQIAGKELQRFSMDLGGLVARAYLDVSLGNTASFQAALDALEKRIAGGGDRGLTWDRRASLAYVLAKGKRLESARTQQQRCLTDLNETRLRSLTTLSLYHFLALNKGLGLDISNPKLRALAFDLLSSEQRGNL